MKYNKIRHLGLFFLLPLALQGCTDWNDHYNDEQNVIAENTLWEEIELRPDLGEFRSLLERYGYKEILDGSQMFTVFAPIDSIDTGSSDEKIKSEVIENHIARFVHSANNAINEKSEVVMLNTKVINLVQDGNTYKFGDNKFTNEYNIRAKNGVLHVIEGQQMYFHNIWEYLTTDDRFSNIRNFLYSFNDTILNEDKSVKGDINENGQQEYLDSVVYIQNPLLYSIGELNNEDSTYTMIVPTNKAWDSAYSRIATYYKDYPTSIPWHKRDSMQRVYTQIGIVRDLVFSHTVQESVSDSLKSTTGGIFKKPFEYILSDYSDWDQSISCSNGGIFVVDSLKHNPWDSWHTPIKIEAENSNVLDEARTTGSVVYRRTLSSADTLYRKVSGGAYLEVVPTSPTAKPKLVFNVWNTLQGQYDVKIVFLPQTRTTSKKAPKPNMFDVSYSSIPSTGEWPSTLTSTFVELDLTNNTLTKMDTVIVGTIKPERCTYGTEYIGLKLILDSSYSDLNVNSTTFLIDCIILEPHNPSKE